MLKYTAVLWGASREVSRLCIASSRLRKVMCPRYINVFARCTRREYLRLPLLGLFIGLWVGNDCKWHLLSISVHQVQILNFFVFWISDHENRHNLWCFHFCRQIARCVIQCIGWEFVSIHQDFRLAVSATWCSMMSPKQIIIATAPNLWKQVCRTPAA